MPSSMASQASIGSRTVNISVPFGRPPGRAGRTRSSVSPPANVVHAAAVDADVAGQRQQRQHRLHRQVAVVPVGEREPGADADRVVLAPQLGESDDLVGRRGRSSMRRVLGRVLAPRRRPAPGGRSAPGRPAAVVRAEQLAGPSPVDRLHLAVRRRPRGSRRPSREGTASSRDAPGTGRPCTLFRYSAS